MLRTLYKQLFRLRRPRPRPVRKKLWQGRAFPALEPLAERIAPAVTAFFSPAGQTLSVFGDSLANTLAISRDASRTVHTKPLTGFPGSPNTKLVCFTPNTNGLPGLIRSLVMRKSTPSSRRIWGT